MNWSRNARHRRANSAGSRNSDSETLMKLDVRFLEVISPSSLSLIWRRWRESMSSVMERSSWAMASGELTPSRREWRTLRAWSISPFSTSQRGLFIVVLFCLVKDIGCGQNGRVDLRLRDEGETSGKRNSWCELKEDRDSPSPIFSCWAIPKCHGVADPASRKSKLVQCEWMISHDSRIMQ